MVCIYIYIYPPTLPSTCPGRAAPGTTVGVERCFSCLSSMTYFSMTFRRTFLVSQCYTLCLHPLLNGQNVSRRLGDAMLETDGWQLARLAMFPGALEKPKLGAAEANLPMQWESCCSPTKSHALPVHPRILVQRAFASQFQF